MKISNTELKVIRFGADDVIATSGFDGPLSGLTRSFYIPASQYSGGSFGGNYVEFNGTFGSYDGSAYMIDNIYGAKGGIDDEQEQLANGGTMSFYGVTIAVPDAENIAKQYYDAYSYGGGTYYSNGLSYYQQYFQ